MPGTAYRLKRIYVSLSLPPGVSTIDESKPVVESKFRDRRVYVIPAVGLEFARTSLQSIYLMEHHTGQNGADDLHLNLQKKPLTLMAAVAQRIEKKELPQIVQDKPRKQFPTSILYTFVTSSLLWILPLVDP